MNKNMESKNTDRELWRERKDDFYSDSIFVTEKGGIGINCGGNVLTMTLRGWHQAGYDFLKSSMPLQGEPSLNLKKDPYA